MNSSLLVIIYLPFHMHYHVKNIFKHVFFDMHDIQILAKKISFLIRKLSKNNSLYPIVGNTKTRKLLFGGLKPHIMPLYCKTTSYNSSLMIPAVQHSFQLLQISPFYICDRLTKNLQWKSKKDILPPFVKVKALLFSINYGHANFPCVFQQKIISYIGKLLKIHIKATFI